MKLKKKYKVLGKDIKVQLIDICDDGEYDSERHLISINNKIKTKAFSETLIHELLHALFDELTEDMDSDFEHTLIKHISKHMVYKWFPDLF